MSIGGWRFAAASIIGTSHAKRGTPCQDANDCEILTNAAGESILVAVVSDGAGSAAHAEEGSALVCRALTGFAIDHIGAGSSISQVSHELAKTWIDNVRGQIGRRAEESDSKPRDYACTVLCAIVGERESVFLQIGDGAIVVLDDEGSGYAHVFWPERGEYENTTFFVTQDDAADCLQYEAVQRRIEEIAVFSDGIQRLALDYKTAMPHEPFFRGMFSPLRIAAEGRSNELSDSLVSFLNSARVNGKTDDDKTLVIASRFAPSSFFE